MLPAFEPSVELTPPREHAGGAPRHSSRRQRAAVSTLRTRNTRVGRSWDAPDALDRRPNDASGETHARRHRRAPTKIQQYPYTPYASTAAPSGTTSTSKFVDDSSIRSRILSSVSLSMPPNSRAMSSIFAFI